MSETKIQRIDDLLRDWAEHMLRGGRPRSNSPIWKLVHAGTRVDCEGPPAEPPDSGHLWRVDKAIQSLQEPDRTTVCTYYLNNWSPGRVGQQVGCTGRTVLTRVYRSQRLIDAWLVSRRK